MNGDCVTKQDLADTEKRLEEGFRQLMKEELTEMENRLKEFMRDTQTELLRGFAAFSEAQTIRLRKVEADQSNLNAATSGRLDILERRLLEIEKRLHIQPPADAA